MVPVRLEGRQNWQVRQVRHASGDLKVSPVVIGVKTVEGLLAFHREHDPADLDRPNNKEGPVRGPELLFFLGRRSGWSITSEKATM